MKGFFVILIALVTFVSVTAQELPTKFTSVDNWQIEGETQFFDQENLYDYINGASDFYLGYKFQDLWVVDYKNKVDQMLSLELYRHGDAMQAFGIYTEERPLEANVLKVGAQGFGDENAIFFQADDYYIKVYNGRAKVAKADLIAFANSVAKLICEDCELPSQFKWFPSDGRVDLSERYMSENFMGITGFNGACTVKYKHLNDKFRLFAYQGTDKKCRYILSKYFERLKHKKKLKEKVYSFDDPYLGNVLLAYKEGVIVGMLDAKQPDAHLELLNQLLDSID